MGFLDALNLGGAGVLPDWLSQMMGNSQTGWSTQPQSAPPSWLGQTIAGLQNGPSAFQQIPPDNQFPMTGYPTGSPVSPSPVAQGDTVPQMPPPAPSVPQPQQGSGLLPISTPSPSVPSPAQSNGIDLGDIASGIGSRLGA